MIKNIGVTRIRNIVAVLALGASLYGCASVNSTVHIPYVPDVKSKMTLTVGKELGLVVPELHFQLIEGYIRNGLYRGGVIASDDDEAERSIVVTLLSYRMRHDAARLTAGVLAGCDTIDSEVIIRSNSTQEYLGRSRVSIKECGGWGVADQVISKYVEGVVSYVLNGAVR